MTPPEAHATRQATHHATHLNAAVTAIRARTSRPVDIALILGSGLGGLADRFDDATVIACSDIPGLPRSDVAGHAGRLVIGELEGASCAAFQGRFHMYEGHDAAMAALPVRILIALGASMLVVTNAAGGINRTFLPGDLMLIDDHLNMTARNPLVGPVLEGETRFPDMSQAYDPDLRALTERVAIEQSIPLVRGVYASVLGPSYETPAEIRMLERLGADAIGMSTVHEVIAARARNVPVLGISLISNAAAGIGQHPLSHDDVLAAGAEASGRLSSLVRGVIRALPHRNA